MIDHAFAGAGLTNRLDSLISVEDVSVFKPDPRVYQLGCDRYHASPEELCLSLQMVGMPPCWAIRV